MSRNQFDPRVLENLFPDAARDARKNEGKMIEIQLEDILPFHTGGPHPFPVADDDDMRNLVEDMRVNGQLAPIIVRWDVHLQGRYETLAGHRRVFAAKYLGWEKIKAVIVEYDDEQATKLMVQDNLQKRSNIKPSTKAHAYQMFIEAHKRQGERVDLTSSPLETKSRTDEKAAEEFGESRATIQRYVRLNQLIPPLLAMVDDGSLKFRVGVELSYLDGDAQKTLHEFMQRHDYIPTLEEAESMKRCQKDGGIVDATYLSRSQGIDTQAEKTEEKAVQPDREKKPKINEKFVNAYLPEAMRKKDVQTKLDYTQQALIHYNRYLQDHPEEADQWV